MGNAKRDHILIWGGSLLIGAALCLLVWNMMNEHRAARSAQQALKGLTATEVQAKLPEPVQPPAEMKAEPLDPAREMPTTTVNGVGYLGTLEIPSLELELAIISQWSDSLLKLAPCQYQGSAYLDNMILAGHNYRAHFAGLKDIQIGDAVIFTDAEDSCFHYEVSGLEELPGTAICEMESGDWDLTLFTCTAGGSARFTVRCIKSEPSHAPGGAPDQVL